MLRQANSNCKIVSHSHLIDNVKLAVAYKVPTVVLIRNPIQTVASYCVFKHPINQIDVPLDNWISYYSYINEVREKVVIVDFEIAIRNVNLVIIALNEMYQKEFKLVKNLERMQEKFLAAKKEKYMKSSNQNMVRKVTIPVPEKNALKKHYTALLEKHPQKETALEIYNNLIST